MAITTALSGAALILLLMLCFRDIRKRAGVEFVAISVLLVEASLICFYWRPTAIFLWQNGRGEPMTLFQGVSIWPTVLLRALSINLCIYFIWRALRNLKSNL
jgi:hypothetical protein